MNKGHRKLLDTYVSNSQCLLTVLRYIYDSLMTKQETDFSINFVVVEEISDLARNHVNMHVRDRLTCFFSVL